MVYRKIKNCDKFGKIILKGPRQTLKETPMRYSMDDDPNIFLKPGPGRILKLEL
jgi:hypothetical protein